MSKSDDFDEMLKCALSMKESAQKIIDIAKRNGSDDTESESEDDSEDNYSSPDGEGEPRPQDKGGRLAAMASALKKKMGK